MQLFGHARFLRNQPRNTRNRPRADRIAPLPWGGTYLLLWNYFFCTYFRQSSMTATRMMMPEITNWRLASMPRVVRA